MPPTTVQIGRIGQMYVKEEATYGTVPALTAAEACRHKALTFPGSDVKNKRTIMEKKASPFTMTQQRTDTRAAAGFSLNAILRPSGTLNTLPEVSPLLKASMGSVVNTTLSTTVSVGTTPLATDHNLGLEEAEIVATQRPSGESRSFSSSGSVGMSASRWPSVASDSV